MGEIEATILQVNQPSAVLNLGIYDIIMITTDKKCFETCLLRLMINVPGGNNEIQKLSSTFQRYRLLVLSQANNYYELKFLQKKIRSAACRKEQKNTIDQDSLQGLIQKVKGFQ